MNILTFTSLYPSEQFPRHGIFIENRIRKLQQIRPPIRFTVVAPVPWFPFKSTIWGRYGRLARVPREENRFGIQVFHPRYLVLPKIGMSIGPLLMTLSLYLFIAKLLKKTKGGIDLLDAHYLYPDCVAACAIANRLGLTFAVTARGSDVNVFPKWRIPNRQIRWALYKADKVFAVCNALKSKISQQFGAQIAVSVVHNGVDLGLFRPATDRHVVRGQLGFVGPTLIFVGNLVPLKGVDLLVHALVDLHEWRLEIVGDGPQLQYLESQVNKLGLVGRVRFHGVLAQPDLVRFYQSADVLVLPSESEGLANVLLEAMATGTPVLATRVGGTEEVLTKDFGESFIESRTAAGIVSAVERLWASKPDRDFTRMHAEKYSSEKSIIKLASMYDNILLRNS